MIFCCIIYLIWWMFAFNPTKNFSSVPKIILFILTLFVGLLGIMFLVVGINKLPCIRENIHNLSIVAIGAVLYVVLLFVTNKIFHRQVTTELILIVGWAILQFCVINSVYKANEMNFPFSIIMIIFVFLAIIISLVCYLQYYKLKAIQAFYVGMIPLALFSIVMATFCVFLSL